MVDFISVAANSLTTNCKVPSVFLELKYEHALSSASLCQVAQPAKAGWHYADLVIRKVRETGKALGYLINPAISMNSKEQANCSQRRFRTSVVKNEREHTFVEVFLIVSLIFMKM
jgi:hypothetical protein